MDEIKNINHETNTKPSIVNDLITNVENKKQKKGFFVPSQDALISDVNKPIIEEKIEVDIKKNYFYTPGDLSTETTDTDKATSTKGTDHSHHFHAPADDELLK